MAGELTGKTFSIKVDVDLGDAESKLQQLKTQVDSLRSSLSKNINTQINVNLDQKGLEDKIDKATKKMNTAAAGVSEQVSKSTKTTQVSDGEPSRKKTSTRGTGGGGSDGPPNRGGGGYFGSEARGDRSGGFLTRAKSVAEFTVAAKAVSGVFSGIEKGLSSIVQVQNQLQQLNKVINTSQANLEDFKKTAIETGKEFGASTTDVLKSFQIFAQQGFSTDEVKKYGKAVIAAKNVSEFDVEELSGLFSTARKTYAKELGDNPQRLTDSLLAVEGQFAVSESELGEVVKRIGPQAKALGMSFDQLNAVTTVMKERTRAPAEEIATSLRFITKNLVDPNVQKDVQAIAGSIGEKIEFTTPTGDIRNSYDILDDLSKLYPKLNNMSKVQLANTVAETRFLPKFAGLMEGYGDAARVVTISQNAQGETTKRNQIAMQSIGKQADKTGQAFEAFALSMGNGMTQPILTALRATEKLLNALEAVANYKLPVLSSISDAMGGINGGTGGQNQGFSVGDTVSKLALPLSLIALSKGLGGFRAMRGVAGGAATSVGTAAGTAAGTTVAGTAAGTTVAGTASKVGIIQQGLGGIAETLMGTAFIKPVTSVIEKFGKGMTSMATSSWFSRNIGTGIGGIAAGAGRGLASGSFAGPAGAVGGLALGALLTAAIQTGFTRVFETGTERSQRQGISSKRAEATAGFGVAKQLQDSSTALTTLNNELDLLTNPQRADELAKTQKVGGTVRSVDEVKAEREKTSKDLRKFIISNEKILRQTSGIDITKEGGVNFQGQDIFANPKLLKSVVDQIKTQQTGAEATYSLGESLNTLRENIDTLSTDENSPLALLKKSAATAGGRAFDLSLTNKETDKDRSFFTKLFTKDFGLQEKETIKAELNTGEVSAPIVKPLINQLNTALRFGKTEDIDKVLQNIGPKNLAAAGQLFDLEQASKIGRDLSILGSSDDPIEKAQARQLLVGAGLKRDFDDIGRAASNARDSMVAGFSKAEKSEEKIAKALELANVGDILSFTGEGGTLNRGRVYEDMFGQKQVQAISKQIFDSSSTSTGQIEVGKSSIIPLKSLLENAVGGVQIFRPKQDLNQDQTKSLFKELQRSGFGAGQTIQSPALSLGPSRLSDLSDIIAGTLQNFSGGEPAFNKDLQQFILQLSKLQKSNAEKFEPGKGITDADTTTTQQLETMRIQEESATLIAKAVESFGRSVKALDSSIQKFQGFQNKQLANEASPITATGPLQKLGGEAIPVAIGKTKAELTPMESAQVELPNTTKQLSQLQFQFGQINGLIEGSANEIDSVLQSINSTSGQSLKSIDQEALKSILGGFKSSGQITEQESTDSTKLIDMLSNSTSDLKNTGKSRDQIISELSSILLKGQTNFQKSLVQSRADSQPQAAQLETALATAASLEALKKGADQAAKSLEQLDKLGGLFDNLDRALGEGPFGRLGAGGQPTFFEQGKDGSMRALDFSNMNSFEQQRELIRRRSSDDVRSGKVKILDQNLSPVSALNEQERKMQLKALEVDEGRAKRANVEQKQREQLSARKDSAIQAIGNIDQLLEDGTLTPKARKGLTGIKREIESVSNLPEKSFITPRGDINLKPFNVLKDIPERIDSLLPTDVRTPTVTNTLKQLQANMGGIAGTSTAAGTTGQSENQQLIGAVNSGASSIVNAIYDVNNMKNSNTPAGNTLPTSATGTTSSNNQSDTFSNYRGNTAVMDVVKNTNETRSLLPESNKLETPELAARLAATGATTYSANMYGDEKIYKAVSSSAPQSELPFNPMDDINKNLNKNMTVSTDQEQIASYKLKNFYTNRPTSSNFKMDSEEKSLYKSEDTPVSNQSLKQSESKIEEGSAKLQEGITTSLADGAGTLAQSIVGAIEAGAKSFQSVFESGANIFQAAMAEFSKSINSRPAPVPAPTPEPKGVGGKEMDVTGMLEQFVTEQARREEDRKIKMSEMEQGFSNMESKVSDLQNKLEQSNSLESLQTFVNQAVQDTKSLAEKALNNAEVVFNQLTTLNSQVKTVEAKVDSTQMLAEQARARGR